MRACVLPRLPAGGGARTGGQSGGWGRPLPTRCEGLLDSVPCCHLQPGRCTRPAWLSANHVPCVQRCSSVLRHAPSGHPAIAAEEVPHLSEESAGAADPQGICQLHVTPQRARGQQAAALLLTERPQAVGACCRSRCSCGTWQPCQLLNLAHCCVCTTLLDIQFSCSASLYTTSAILSKFMASGKPRSCS